MADSHQHHPPRKPTRHQTTRIDLNQAIRAGRLRPAAGAAETRTDEQRARLLRQSTMPVEDVEASPAGGEPAAPASDLSPAEREALLRKRTMEVHLGDAAGPAAPEDLLTKSTVPIESPRAGAPAPVAPPPGPKSTAVIGEAAKGKTARIELPPDGAAAARGPGGKPKTIKIKRAEPTAQRRSPATAKVKARPRQSTGTPAPAGLLPTALLMVSVFVIGALIYLLLAQTLAPDLPAPGRPPI